MTLNKQMFAPYKAQARVLKVLPRIFHSLIRLRNRCRENVQTCRPARMQMRPHACEVSGPAHPSRLLVVGELSRGERCVWELAGLGGAEMPTVSRHLALLCETGIEEDEKRWVQLFYRLKALCAMSFFRCVVEMRNRAMEA